jgi:hypothetical protein
VTSHAIRRPLILAVALALAAICAAAPSPAETDPTARAAAESPPASAAGSPEACAGAKAKSRDFWDYLSSLGPIVSLVGVLAALHLGLRSWRLTYFTKEWSTLVQLLRQDPEFMDPEKLANYQAEFTGDEAIKYEMTARLCVGYLDDLYFLRSRREMRNWFRGSIHLLGGRHRAWLENNRGSYDDRFYTFLMEELNRPLQPACSGPAHSGGAA